MKRMATFAVVCASAFLPNSAALSASSRQAALVSHIAAKAGAQNAVLNIQTLSERAGWVENWSPKDQFDAPPTGSDLVGRHFHVVEPVQEYGPSTSWTYDLQSQTLTLRIHSITLSHSMLLGYDSLPAGSYVFGIPLVDSEREGGSYLAENHFGATVSVSTIGKHRLLISPSEPGRNRAIRKNMASDRILRMTPERARGYVGELRFVVDGTVSKFDDGRTIECGGEYSEPTMDKPLESYGTSCAVAMEATNVEIIDKNGNSVLDTSKDRFGYYDTVTNLVLSPDIGAINRRFRELAPANSTARIGCLVKTRPNLSNCEFIEASPDVEEVWHAAWSALAGGVTLSPQSDNPTTEGKVVVIDLFSGPSPAP
jgi:hypothetical protein